MRSDNFFRPGSYHFICDVCGQKHHKEQMRIRWDNMVVCPKDFEYRHPQDFLRAREDRQAVPISRPRPVDVFRHVEGLRDTVEISDDGVPYIDETYFLEDYIVDTGIRITMLFNKAFSDSFTLADSSNIQVIKSFSDAFSLSDTGVITLPAYIDITYFAEDYIATTQGF